MDPIFSVRQCILLAPALVIACDRPRALPPPRRLVDAAVMVPVRAERVDAAVRTPTPAPAPIAPQSSLDLFVVGGAEILRPGSSASLRLNHYIPGVPHAADATRSATFRVEPLDRGTIDGAGVFHALTLGRAQLIATLGTEEARTIVEISALLPAGVTALPTLQVGGHVARSVHFGMLPDGTIALDVQAEGVSLALRGRRSGTTFPMTIPVSDTSSQRVEDPDGGASDAGAMSGTLVIDRWINQRLEGHAALHLAGQPLQLRFAVLLVDVSPLRARQPAARTSP